MKQAVFLITLIGVIFLFSCKKSCSIDNELSSLNGKWRMIIVKENVSGFTTTKASAIHGEVEITFISTSSTAGSFIGNTPTNEIWQNDYVIGSNKSITIPTLSMTKVMETSWGKEFVDNIRNSQEYNFERGGKLNIKTTNKTLTFRKL